jgi:hypothetical protein
MIHADGGWSGTAVRSAITGNKMQDSPHSGKIQALTILHFA